MVREKQEVGHLKRDSATFQVGQFVPIAERSRWEILHGNVLKAEMFCLLAYLMFTAASCNKNPVKLGGNLFFGLWLWWGVGISAHGLSCFAPVMRWHITAVTSLPWWQQKSSCDWARGVGWMLPPQPNFLTLELLNNSRWKTKPSALESGGVSKI